MAEKTSEKSGRPERERTMRSALEPFEVGRWSPFRDFGMGLGRLFDEVIGDRAAAGSALRWAPAVEVAENDAAYVVTAELPGAKREDIEVELHDDVLSIRGEKKSEREEKNEKRHYVERTYGSFSRSFTLPANARGDQIRATFQDGVLTVEIPKGEAAKPKAIRIES